MTTDSFGAEARGFVLQFDRLRLPEKKALDDLPEKPDVRVVIRMAERIWLQHNNPFRDFDVVELLVLDLAACFLRWAADFGNVRRWEEMFNIRGQLEDMSPDEFGWELDDC